LPQGIGYAHFIDMFWLILRLLLAVSFGSLLIIINGLRKAPEAFEGEHGLAHFARKAERRRRSTEQEISHQ
jgi:hypothetical protein